MIVSLITFVLSVLLGGQELLTSLTKAPNNNYIVLRQNKSFKKQVVFPNTIYVIRKSFDLGEVFRGVKLNERITFNNQIVFTHSTPIQLVEGQIIRVPKGCIILNSKKKQSLSSDGFYRSQAIENVYISSKRQRSISYRVSGVVKIPTGSTLIISKGQLFNGAIDFNNCKLQGRDNCLCSVQVKGRCSSSCCVDWFSDQEDSNKIESAISLSKDVVFASRDYYINDKISAEGIHHLNLDGRGARLHINKPIYFSFNDCSDLHIENLFLDAHNNTSRVFLFSNCSNLELIGCTFCNIGGDRNSGVYGCYFSNCIHTSIQDCLFRDIVASPKNGSARGLHFAYDKENGKKCRYIAIEGCEFNNIHAPSFFEGDGKDDTDCIYIAGIYVDDGYADAIVSNCRFVDYGKRGVKAQARGVNVSDCFFIDEDSTKLHKHWRAVELFGSESAVRNCTIRLLSFERAIQVYNEGEIVMSNGKLKIDRSMSISNVFVENNYIEKPSNLDISYGVYIGNSDKNLCEYNSVYILSNVIKGVYCGVKMTGFGKDITISNNDIGTTRNGIIITSEKVDGELDGKTYSFTGLYSNCLVSNNFITGIELENETRNKKTAIQFNCVNSKISNNVIDNFNNGIVSLNYYSAIQSNKFQKVKNVIIGNNKKDSIKE